MGLKYFGEVKEDLWYIDITPEIREHFSEQGIPLTMRQRGLLPEQGVGLLA